MNIKRPLSTMTLCKAKQDFCFTYSQSAITRVSISNFGSCKSLGRRAQCFGLFKVKIRSNFDHDRALKQSLNVKNLIQQRFKNLMSRISTLTFKMPWQLIVHILLSPYCSSVSPLNF